MSYIADELQVNTCMQLFSYSIIEAVSVQLLGSVRFCDVQLVITRTRYLSLCHKCQWVLAREILAFFCDLRRHKVSPCCWRGLEFKSHCDALTPSLLNIIYRRIALHHIG